MKWFLDTEFHEDGKTIDLISIALVSQDGREYYAVSSEFDEARCSDWVKQNVLPKLPPRITWKPRHQIAAEIQSLVLTKLDSSAPGAIAIEASQRPEFWAYYADYDWVALCQLYGTMMQLPTGFPMLCMDFKQVMMQSGITRDMLPAQDAASEHDALGDARWLRQCFEWWIGGAR